MSENKYTDEQIVKALEICIEGSSCKECPINPNHGNYGYCTNLALTHALDLINRQSEKIADLEDENKGLKETNEHLSGEYIALSKENDKMRKVINADVVIINRRGGKSEYVKEIIRIKTSLVKAEAYKEFAERLKCKMQDLARLDYGGTVLFLVGEKFIDELVEEMTEGG